MQGGAGVRVPPPTTSIMRPRAGGSFLPPLLPRQVGKMTAVNHPCIVRCYGMLEPTPGIVLELVEGSSLFQIVHGERGESFMMVRPAAAPCGPARVGLARAVRAGSADGFPSAVPAKAAVGGSAALPARLRLRPQVLFDASLCPPPTPSPPRRPPPLRLARGRASRAQA